MINGCGEYRMRDGERAVVTNYFGELDFPYRGFTGGGTDTGLPSSWREDGRYQHFVENSLDIIGPWVEQVAPVVITGLGSYVLRDGRRAEVIKNDGDISRPWKGLLSERDIWWTTSGLFFEGEESPLDIIGPWVEPVTEPAPFVISGPGAYVMRDGRRVEITIIDDGYYPCGGSVNGSEDWWMRDGRFLEGQENYRDIVGPWVEPVVEMCERCKQLLAERDSLRTELFDLKRRVLNSVNGVITKVKQ